MKDGLVRIRKRRVQEGSEVEEPKKPVEKTCYACAYSFMEPDSPLVCGHPDTNNGGWGLNIGYQGKPLEHCGDFTKFKQHPGRRPDGSLKGL